jgi:hypothetical protein
MVMAMWVCDIRYEAYFMQGMKNIFIVLMFSLFSIFFELLRREFISSKLLVSQNPREVSN